MSLAAELTQAHGMERTFSPEAKLPTSDDPLNWEPAAHPNPYAENTNRSAIVSAGIAHSTLSMFHAAAALAAERESIIAQEPYHGRQAKFVEFAWTSAGLNYSRAMHYVRVSDAIPEPFWAEFSGFEWTTILAVEKYTALRGDTPGDRRARILSVLSEAKSRNFGDDGVRVLLTETLERDHLERFGPADGNLPADLGRDSALGVPGPAEAPPARVRASVERDGEREPVEACVDQTHAFVGDPRQPDLPEPDAGLLARVQRLEQFLSPEKLTDGLEGRFRRENPGTFSHMVEVVQEHLNAKLGGVL